MKFRARLVDPANSAAQRPIEMFTNSREEVDRWARETLKKAVGENAIVNVYQSVETHIGIIVKPKEEGTAPAPPATEGEA